MSDLTVVRAGELRTALMMVWHAVANNEAHPVLTTMCFVKVGERLRLVAADNYRIAMYDLRTVDDSPLDQFELPALLPRADVKMLRAIITPMNDVVSLSVANERLRVDWHYGAIEFKLMAGTFPDYTQLLRPETPPTVSLCPAFMGEVGKALAKYPSVDIKIGGPREPVILRSEGVPFTEVLMPMLSKPVHEATKAESA